ncbi:hypothetical protein PTKIN_Ptkin14bG0185800 [Pterospermum kingtungense]
MMHEPDALWVQVLKGRYFANSDVLDARKGNDARFEVLLGNRSRDIVNVNRISLAEVEYSLANKLSIGHVQIEINADCERVEAWQKPEEDWIKINCDGAWSGNSSFAGVGVIARDCSAMVIAGKGEQVRGDSSIMVEAIACREGQASC